MATTQATPCAKQVIADWYDDGRVGKIYPLECYRQAISSLPPDVLDYSNAKEEIGRALAFAKQGKPDPGGKDPTPPTTGTGTSGTGTNGTGTNGTDTTGPARTGPTRPEPARTGPTTTGTGTNGIDTTGADTGTTDTSGPSSVPIPLLVLGGLAVLLLAAGSAGYFRRRMRAMETATARLPPLRSDGRAVH